jgi:uncharacterized protein with NAD-binding domain and iron-sulfur cluster
MTPSDSKQRIAVLGGGLSSLTAVFELTSVPNWSERYSITVYQMGFRLGGKCASGRNQEIADRIEEHGLHVFFGFYENAMGIVRRCYQELGRGPDEPLATWRDAFKPRDLIVMEEWLKDEWHHWPLPFPRNGQSPGDWCEPFPDFGHSTGQWSELPSPFSYLQMILQLVGDMFDQWWWRKHQQRLGDQRAAIDSLLQNATGAGVQSALELGQSLFEMLGTPLRDLEALALHAALALTKRLPRDAREHGVIRHKQLGWLLARFRRWIARELQPEITSDFDTYKLFISLDLAATVTIGMLEDGLLIPPAHWHDVDDEDFCAWLKRHGGSDLMIASAPVRTLYSACFATGATGAAGTTLYACMRMLFTYKGAVLWELQAGMGDTIFAPLYTVLKRRGVKFEFFARVDELKLGEKDAKGKRSLEEIVIGRQVTLAEGVSSYDPLITVNGLPCWPSEPRYEQLAQGEELKRLQREHPDEYGLENWWTKWTDRGGVQRLRKGVDFDLCLLGIGIGAFPYICEDLIADTDNPKFKTMVDTVQTTLTQGAQLWFRPSLDAMGWPMQRPVVIPYAEPYDTWSDMSHLIVRERWNEIGHPVGSIAYMCSRLADPPGFKPPPRTDHAYPFGQLERARQNLGEWLRTQTRQIWPYAGQTSDPNELNYDWLVDPEGREGIARLDAQYWVADWNPSDRYVLTAAGATRARLRSEQSGYDNLFLTGDWTLNSINTGCAEAATMTGMLASRAICGYPQRILGDWLDEQGSRERQRPEPKPPLAQRPGYSLRRDPIPEVPYIPRPGDLLSLPPLAASGVTMSCFVMQAERPALKLLCDKYLNLGPTVYKPLVPLAVFVAAHLSKAHPVGAADKGWMEERDFAIWIPLMAGKNVGGRFELDRFVWYQPYMWIDNAVAVACGREVYGLEKSFADLQSPKRASEPAKFGVDTVVSVLERDIAAKMAPLVRVHAQDRDSFGDHTVRWRGSRQISGALKDALRPTARGGDWERDLELLDELLTGEQILAGLKQTPSITADKAASYQAIVETPSSATSEVSAALIAGNYAVDIKFWPSHDVVSVCGLKTTDLKDGWQRAQSILNVQFKFDLAMGPGREIYRLA